MSAIGIRSGRPAGATSRRLPGHFPRFPFGGDRHATATLEFVLLSAPMLMMLFGFVATNLAIYSWTAMQNNAQNAALMISTNQVSNFSTGAITLANNTVTVTCSGSLTTSQAEYWACVGLPTWASFKVTATESCGTTPQTVAVSVQVAPGSNAGLADTYSFFVNKTLVTRATVMKQGNCP